jgi:hypothetical protein
MKKILAAAGIGAALAVGPLLGIGTASADTSTAYYPSGSKGDQSAVGYDNDLVAEGIPGSVSQASGLGATVCGNLRAGHSEETLVATVAQTPGLNPTVNQAKVVVWSAEWHFCPSYY